ncbi:iron ABC transporter substrate-binding protein [Salicola sp. Rm-C-2C1-2]|uniref:iron ABC transporter substrate-binding protein n=1 Tax=Salicola sp. Rm-C-2C1-2 TaxID=3141321 RepID=UPI0032E40AA9
MQNKLIGLIVLVLIAASGYLGISAVNQPSTLTLYSGRGESMVRPMIERFESKTDINIDVRYGDTAQLAVLLQKEDGQTSADLFWGQDAGAMASLAKADRLATLPESLYADLPPTFRSRTGDWVAVTGRARTFVYAPDRVSEHDMPESVFELTEPQYRGRVGWAPTNGSFQSFVTAMRHRHGDERTLEWLRAMDDNDARIFPNNSSQVEGVADGAIDFGLVNNYYLPHYKANNEAYPAEQAFFEAGDIGNLVNVAGTGIIKGTDNRENAIRFIRFLLSPEAQEYFTQQVHEYPVRGGVDRNPELKPLDELLKAAPKIDLNELEDLEATLDLLREANLI